MTDQVEPKVMGDEKKRMKRKQSLEVSVTLGLGYGKKKKQNVEAFYTAVWPVLEGVGWKLAKGEGEEEGATYFLPPGVTLGKKGKAQEDVPQKTSSAVNTDTASNKGGSWDCASCGHSNVAGKFRCTGINSEGSKCMAWKGGKRLRKPYFSKVRDVIERVLEKKNEAESMAADAYLAIVPDAHEIFIDPKDKKKESPPPRRPPQSMNHSAWKDAERTHYEKTASQVGPEFQVSILPAAGSYTPVNDHPDGLDGGPLYDRVWDPDEAEKLGRHDFVHTRVKFNKKAAAYDLLYKRGYHLPGFYHEVSSLSPTDCSDWTKEDKDRFRAAVFEHHENMKEVSKQIGKSMGECITYYIVKFKRTKSYKSLKRSMRRKANVTEGSAGTLVCNQCGKGGMLIACDTCEAHYHLSCASPPLQSIPNGTWACGNCKRETRSMLSSQDDVSCGTDQQPAEALVDGKMDGSEGIALNDSGYDGNLKPNPESGNLNGLEHFNREGPSKHKLDSKGAAAKEPEDDEIEGQGDALGNLKHDNEDAQLQLSLKFGPKHIQEISGASHKRKLESENMSKQEDTPPNSKQMDDSSSCKKMRLDEDVVAKSLAVVPV